MIYNRGHWKQSLQINIFTAVLTNNVGICVNHTQNMSDVPLSKVQFTNILNKVNNSTEHFVIFVRRLSVVHQNIQHFPHIRIMFLEPENSECHDGVVPFVGLAEISDDEPAKIDN